MDPVRFCRTQRGCVTCTGRGISLGWKEGPLFHSDRREQENKDVEEDKHDDAQQL